MGSLDSIRPYFQLVMAAVDKDFREHEDAFNVDNIPNSHLDCAWHISVNDGTLDSFNQTCLRFQVPIILNAWVKGYKTPIEAVDSGLKKIEAIIQEASRHSRRLNQPFIKNVQPSAFNVSAIADSNDNIAKLTLNFNCLLYIEIET